MPQDVVCGFQTAIRWEGGAEEARPLLVGGGRQRELARSRSMSDPAVGREGGGGDAGRDCWPASEETRALGCY